MAGLTPPAYNSDAKKGRKARAALWREYVATIKRLAPIHHVLYLGDGIDGRGQMSGGTELLTTDMMEQAQMATECLNVIRLHGKVPRTFSIVGVYGTGYHTGKYEDFEDIIAKDAGFDKIGGHEWPQVYNTVFDIKHKIGGSSVPYGRLTAAQKARLWNREWAAVGEQPLATCLIRGHVHYFGGGIDSRGGAFTAPAWQGYGSKFGIRQCEGKVDWGCMWFDVNKHGYQPGWHTPSLPQHKAEVTLL